MLRHRYISRVAAVAVAIALILFPGLACAQSEPDSRVHQLHMKDVDLSVFISDIARMTGHTFILHPQIRGRVSLYSSQKLDSAEVFDVFRATLRAHGYTVIATRQGAYRIAPVREGVRSGRAGDFRTIVLRLGNANPEEVARLIAPMMSEAGFVTGSRKSGMIVMADRRENLDRVRAIVAEMDNRRLRVATLALRYVQASEIVKLVNGLGSRSGDGAGSLRVAALSVSGSNSVVLQGDAGDILRVTAIIGDVDRENAASATSVEVIALEHASASELAPILQRLATSIAGKTPGSTRAATVAAYDPTNALILSAEPSVVRQIKRIVSRLDVRQAQVLVDAIIVELSDDKVRELGVQFALSGGNDSGAPLVASNFTSSPLGLLKLSGALAPESGGAAPVSSLTGAALSELSGANSLFGLFGNRNADGSFFTALLSAIETDSESRILSTPSILTLDNQTARILVGQEIPITKGEALRTNSDTPFRTIDRMDVGVQLQVTPQISEGDVIRLEVTQTVSSVAGPVTPGSSDLLTNKREVTTTILADDGEVIVLGGLIENTEVVRESKLPVFGDIPVLGILFRSRRRSAVRTNLMVFLRPVIVRDGEGSRRETVRKFIASGVEKDGDLDDFIARTLEVGK